MPMPPVHFAAGMLASSLVGAVVAAVRRRWLIWLPFVMTLCGLLALAPDLARQPDAPGPHSPLLNLFFLHPALDRQPALHAPAAAHTAFHLIAAAYLLAACAYASYIRFRLPRLADAPEALARVHRATRGCRLALAFLTIAPILVLGGAVGWLLRVERPSHERARALGQERTRHWRRLVGRRMRVFPGHQLGLVHAIPWTSGAWLNGDLAVHTTPRGGATPPEEAVEAALSNRCDFVVLADGSQAATQEQLAAHTDELRRIRGKFHDLAILHGLPWNAGPEASRPALLIVPPNDEARLLRSFAGHLSGSPSGTSRSPAGALRWLERRARDPLAAPVVLSTSSPRGQRPDPELFAWSRASHLYLGPIGLNVSARPPSGTRWDRRVARLGGEWDRLLDAGIRLWAATAASGLGDARTHSWPGEYARTHVWCPGRRPADVLAGLRAGCFWAEEGGIVKTLDFTLVAPTVRRPVRMGEVVLVAPGAEVGVTLRLELPENDTAGRPVETLDAIELISNFSGQAQVVRTFRDVRSLRYLRHVFPPAADRNGGLGFYVRARGRRDLPNGRSQLFHTNPIRVLVRDLPEPPPSQLPRLAGAKPPKGPPDNGVARPKPTSGGKPSPAIEDLDEKLKAIGLPRDLPVLHLETFHKRPGKEWQGAWTARAAGRGPAIADHGLRAALLRRTRVAPDTRLFFRCYAIDCHTLTIRLRTGLSSRPYQLVRTVRDRQWIELDLSITDDFFPPRGAPGRILPPAEVDAIEWQAAPSGAQATFYISDLVIYQPTRSRRRDRIRQRLDELARETRLARDIPRPSPSWGQRLDDLGRAIRGLRARVGTADEPLVPKTTSDLDREVRRLAHALRRLHLEADMARAFRTPEPPYTVGLESPQRRVSARNPAHRFRGTVARSCELAAAAGEAESVQIIVFALRQPLHAVDLTWTALEPEKGDGPPIPASALTANVVSELWVHRRADLPPERTGWTPDPLLPFTPFDVAPGRLRSVLLTVRVPLDVPPGTYRGTVAIQPRGLAPVRMGLRVHRWGFALVGSHFPVLAPVDEAAIRRHYQLPKGLDGTRRRQLYRLLLDHRVGPIPHLTGSPRADLDQIASCIEGGLGLVVLYEASRPPTERNARFAQAIRYARKIWEAGHGHRGAILLHLPTAASSRRAAIQGINLLARRHPGLRILADGAGHLPPELRADYWLGQPSDEGRAPPSTTRLEIRRARTSRRPAWHLRPGAPDFPQPNATLANRLVETRLLPLLAWRHGIRALLLPGATRWQSHTTGDGFLVYPSPTGRFLSSLRLVALRDGIEDYETLRLVWSRALQLQRIAPQRGLAALASATAANSQLERKIGSLELPALDLAALADLRRQFGRAAQLLEATWWTEIDRAQDLPQPPGQLSAEAGDRRVDLTWKPSADKNVTGYAVYRSTHPERGYVRLNTTPITDTRFVDRAATNGIRYYYILRAVHGPRFEGRRSRRVHATPKPAPKVVWLPLADLTHASLGPYHIVLRLEGPGTAGLLPRVRPQIDYCLSDGAYDGFEEMTHHEDGTWSFDVPDLQWRRNASRSLRCQVRIVDRQSRLVTPPVERVELIDSFTLPKGP